MANVGGGRQSRKACHPVTNDSMMTRLESRGLEGTCLLLLSEKESWHSCRKTDDDIIMGQWSGYTKLQVSSRR